VCYEAEVFPFIWNGFAEEGEDSLSELFLRWVMAIMRHVLVHDGP
jgi:hypothetical protein